MNRRSSLLVLSLFLGLAGGVQAASHTGAAAAKAAASPVAADRAAPSKLARADIAFLTKAAQAGHAEVESSKIAVDKAVNTQVKGFAQQMVDDHGKASAELASLAAAKGVKLPDGPSVMQKTKIKLLAARDGAGFDRQYASGMGVSAHEDTVKLFQKAAREAKDPDVKAFASKTLPTLEHHLKMARELKAVTDKEGNAKALKDRKQ